MALTYAHLSWTPAILVRVYGWKVAEIGIIYGILIGATAIGGLLLNGGITDRLFSRGASDAHLRYYATASLILAAFGGATSLAPTGSLFLLLLIPVLLLTSLGGVAAAAVQIVTPPTLRGRVSALYLMIVSMFGLVVGPSSVAILSDYVVGTDNIGLAFSLAYLVLAPIAAAFLFRGMKHMRMALTEDHGPSTVMDMPTLPSGHRAA
jgi:MFS family permease